jgi:hypothetical protein
MRVARGRLSLREGPAFGLEWNDTAERVNRHASPLAGGFWIGTQALYA